jgi:hypothetical protein
MEKWQPMARQRVGPVTRVAKMLAVYGRATYL